MIHLVVDRVVQELGSYIGLRFQAMHDQVVATTLVDLSGAPRTEAQDRVVVNVVAVEEDRVYQSVERYERRADGVGELIGPEVRANVYLLFAANMVKYDEALKALSGVIAFFQRTRSFEFPGTDAPSRVTFDLHSLNFEQQNHLWAALGAKYVPSVLYKVGILGIRDAAVAAEVHPVKEIHAGA